MGVGAEEVFSEFPGPYTGRECILYFLAGSTCTVKIILYYYTLLLNKDGRGH